MRICDLVLQEMMETKKQTTLLFKCEMHESVLKEKNVTIFYRQSTYHMAYFSKENAQIGGNVRS